MDKLTNMEQATSNEKATSSKFRLKRGLYGQRGFEVDEIGDKLFHGTDKKGFQRLLDDEHICYEYAADSGYEHGVYLTNSAEKARCHGIYILEIDLNYSIHKQLVDVCNRNVDCDYDFENYDYWFDLEEGERECFYNGTLNTGNVITVWKPGQYEWSEDGSVIKLSRGEIPW